MKGTILAFIEWIDDDSSESEEESSGHYDENWATNKPTTRYFYDGQMGFEDDFTIDGGGSRSVTVTRYAVGARGIDGIETKVDTQSAVAVYPVYDGHGNMIATLARNGSSFTRVNNRVYDAWGNVTSGSGGDQGHVANLGHRKDPESGLTYMRARYYEPGSGRFISQDPAFSGWNWYRYARNNPINRVDFSGKTDIADAFAMVGLMAFLGHALMGIGLASFGQIEAAVPVVLVGIIFATLAFDFSFNVEAGGPDLADSMWFTNNVFKAVVSYWGSTVVQTLGAVYAGDKNLAGSTVRAVALYSFFLMGALLWETLD